ncbi:MAG: hypothetical protein FWD29_03945 [Micrococcales bacterium]|nr:hypothetical protein [Micrococcales bacterium]
MRLGTRQLTTLAVVALTTGLAIAGGLIATAAPAPVAATPNPSIVVSDWDGPTKGLHWQGMSRTYVVIDAFHGQVTAVPGDLVHRTLNVQNCGPCDATLTVSMIRASTITAFNTKNHVGDPFEEMSLIHWDVAGQTGTISFADVAAAGQMDLATIPIALNATEQVKLAYDFPYAMTTGKHLGSPSQILLYDVQFVVQGQPCSGPTISPTTSPGPGGPGGPGGKGALAFTGSDPMVPGLTAAVLLLTGVLLLAARRRRRRQDEPTA